MLVRSACAAATRIIRADIFVDRLSSSLAQLLRHELEHGVCKFTAQNYLADGEVIIKEYLSLSAIYFRQKPVSDMYQPL